ncbi:MAG TPA: hypothetical protein VKP69_22110, partial [Isosphaeraceae bacterium]|nr:hypothetical protein [Isosphaeraceae bacterium]
AHGQQEDDADLRDGLDGVLENRGGSSPPLPNPRPPSRSSGIVERPIRLPSRAGVARPRPAR